MGVQIAVVYVDNWQALYINERLVLQAHEITIPVLMEFVLYRSVDLFEYIEASESNMNTEWGYPDCLGDVVLPGGITFQQRREKEMESRG